MHIINGVDINRVEEVKKQMITNKTRDLIKNIINSWISVAL